MRREVVGEGSGIWVLQAVTPKIPRKRAAPPTSNEIPLIFLASYPVFRTLPKQRDARGERLIRPSERGDDARGLRDTSWDPLAFHHGHDGPVEIVGGDSLDG